MFMNFRGKKSGPGGLRGRLGRLIIKNEKGPIKVVLW